MKAPAVHSAVTVAPSVATKFAVALSPVAIVASARATSPSTKIVTAFPFHPSPHESNIFSVYTTGRPLGVASNKILEDPLQ